MSQKGYTLVEVVIAMLLASIMISSVFSVALSAKQAGSKSERRLAAAQATKQMHSMLKSYVTSDYSASCAIAGPNANNPSNRWAIRDLTVTPNVTDTYSGGLTEEYALRPGTHTVTGIVPGWMAAAPYNAVMTYYVGTETVSGDPVPQVNVSVNWTEP